MHELSIALSMIELATDEAQRRGGVRVNALHLRVGPLSGVVKDALLFSYEVASNGTVLEGSRLIIEDVPVVIYCAECEAEREVESIQRFCCPVCGTLSSEIRGGRELEFVAMEIGEIGEIEERAERAEIEETVQAHAPDAIGAIDALGVMQQQEELAR